MTMSQNTEFNKWADAYEKMMQQGTERQWPSETLIRLIRGPYLAQYNLKFAESKILDVGFGAGEAFYFLNTLGARLYGTEVDQSICDSVSDRLSHVGIDAELRVGTNTSLPFPDDNFDYLVSWNVIHYESNEKDMLAAIQEYARILKKGGRIFVSTTGPKHKILKDATSIAPHQYRIGRQDDHRKGQVFFYFDQPDEIQRIFSTAFSDILIGRTHDHLFTETLDWFIVSASKP